MRRALWGALAGGLLVFGLWLGVWLVPLPEPLFKPAPAPTEFLDRNGLPLRTLPAGSGQFQRQVVFADLPPHLVDAMLAAEDHRFWRHSGVDWWATARAAWQLVSQRRVVSGGSTITQQLIKQVVHRPRTLRTKCCEALQALRLERAWSKQRIITEYLNRIEFGNGIRGCAAAARFYFGKSLRDLSSAECALLAALPQAPSRLNPHRYPELARKRQHWVLARMREFGWITEDEFDRALNEPLRLAGAKRRFEAPHFVDMLLAQVGANAGPVRTTLDLRLNRFAESALKRQLGRLRDQHVANGAVAVIENKSGDVLAMVGSQDFFAPGAGQVNGAWAPRSAGSTFKPFTYLLALERGANPASIVADVPAEFATATGVFAPANYDRHCHGPMRYRLALANSLNIPAVKVLASCGGPELLLHRLRACGLTTLTRSAEDYGLGLTIGNAEARLLELANAYACLARLGQYQPFRLVREPGASSRIVPLVNGGQRTKRCVADPTAAYLVADILSDNDARMLAFGAESPLRFTYPVACKTGTSSDFRDNWAFGYTPEYTVGVWVGNFDGSPMQEVSGVTGAAPLLHEIFEHLHEQYGTSWYEQPSSVVTCWVHPLTGKRLVRRRAEDGAVMEKCPADRLPPEASTNDFDAEGRLRLPGEYRDWLVGGDNWLGARAVAVDSEEPDIGILFPLPGSRFYLDPDLANQGRDVYLRARGGRQIEWRSDSLKIAVDRGRSMAVLAPGRHQIIAFDPVAGSRAETWIDVVDLRLPRPDSGRAVLPAGEFSD